MERLPYIDEHATPVDAAPAEVWEALLRVLPRVFGGRTAFVRALGCDPATASPAFAGAAGETIPGFRVAAAEPARRLELRGRHRFSRYQLTFTIAGDRLAAETRAAFPGPHGRVYRALVVGSGAHRVVTRRLLAAVARRAAA